MTSVLLDPPHQVAGLMVEGAKHLVHVRLLLVLQGAPLEGLSNGVSKWGKDLLGLWADNVNGHT